MPNLIAEIRSSYQNKIAALQREIERLRAKMTSVITALQEDIGEEEENPTNIIIPKRAPIVKKVTQSDMDKEPNTRIRVIQAVDRMPLSGFGTNELIQSLNKDGNIKQPNKNRALKIFRTLIDEGLVTVVQEHSGKRGGIYQKTVMVSQAESSSSIFNPHNVIEEEKGGSDYAR
jgi:hypothetical protein